MKVLLVDDGTPQALALAQLLEREGHQVERAKSGVEALGRMTRPERPDWVLAELSTLAASIAHEINNPLTYVAGNLTLLDDELQARPGEGALRSLVQGALDGALRLVRWVSALQPAAVEFAVRARVLVIDDEPQVGALLERALGREHEVTVLTSAREALARLTAGERWSAIVCDLMMPDMTGMELHARLAAQLPEVVGRMVFVSGGAFTPEAQAFLERVANPRLDKPVDLPRLRALLRYIVLREST